MHELAFVSVVYSLANLGVDGGNIETDLKKSVTMWTGFIWFKTWTSDGFL